MYDLQINRIADQIKEAKAKRVLIQLPDGLKSKANELVDALEEQAGAQILIWFGSCFGACDVPQGLKPLSVDLLIQYGHNRYNKTEEW